MGEHLILMHELNIMFVLFWILVMHVQENDRTFYVTKVAFLHEIAHFKSLPLIIGCTKCINCMGFKMLTKIEETTAC